MDTQKSLSRRSLLRRGASAAGAIFAPYVIPASALGLDGKTAPSNRIAMGFIGLGGRGSHGMRTFMGQKDVQAVAVCDVSRDNGWRPRQPPGAVTGLEPARLRAKLPKESAYQDFRELLGRGDIDAVQIATGARWHPVIAAAAVRAGIDCYCEKPLALSIKAGKALRELCHRYNPVFQFGTQQRSDRMFRFACELVRNRRIGKLHTVKLGVYGSQIDSTYSYPPADYQPGEVPPELDYDLWTGPSQMRPFIKSVISPYWHFMSDYALGFIHNWGIHHTDIIQWASEVDGTGGPVEVEGKGVRPRSTKLCDTLTAWDVEMRYADGVRVIYTDNDEKIGWQQEADDKDWLYQQAGKNPKNKQGLLFEGDEGWVSIRRGHIDAHPKSLLQTEFGPNEIRLPRSSLHERNFLDCVRSRQPAISNIDVAARSDALCHLSLIAIATGRKLKWDPVKEEFVGDDEANRLLSGPMRAPWRV